MSQPPKLNFHVVSEREMQKLLDRPECKELLAKITPERVPQPQGEAHETLCCKKVLLIFSDGDGDEVASGIEQIFSHSPNVTKMTITKLRIGNDIHQLRLP
jgi:hypothetical protein